MHLTGRKNPQVKFGDLEKNYQQRRTLLELFFFSKNSKMDLGILPIFNTQRMLIVEILLCTTSYFTQLHILDVNWHPYFYF